MANVTIKTNITNTTDSASTTLTASLVGVPNTGSTIISNRTFTPKTNCKFTKVPHVSFEKTSSPNSYSYTVVENFDGSYSFTVNYFRPISTLPTTDIIEFFAIAKTNVTPSGLKIYGWNIDTSQVKSYGEKRKLRVSGDPSAKVKVSMTQTPRIGTESNGVTIISEYIATIGANGVYETLINFPAITGNLPVNYRVTLAENTSGTFTSGLTKTPTNIILRQFPIHQVKLQIIETSDTTWTLPSSGVGSDYYLYSSERGGSSGEQEFSFSCSHAADISADGTFEAADFTQVTGNGNSLSSTYYPTIASDISYKDLSYTIDNTVSPNTVIITGKLNIKHGYDGSGNTYVTLNINDILNHA